MSDDLVELSDDDREHLNGPPAPPAAFRRERCDLQKFLHDLVRSAGITQSELARQTGLTEKHVSQMMTGRVQGTLSTWQALLDAAGVEVPEI